MAWLDANRSAFAVPVRLGRRTNTSWEIHFEGIAPNINAVLIGKGKQYELVVVVDWQGRCWDLLASFETIPVREGRTYYCDSCEESHRRLFESRQELWTDHLFIPFLEWVNTKLEPANWLVFDDFIGMTSVKLTVEYPEDKPNRLIVPLSIG